MLAGEKASFHTVKPFNLPLYGGPNGFVLSLSILFSHPPRLSWMHSSNLDSLISFICGKKNDLGIFLTQPFKGERPQIHEFQYGHEPLRESGIVPVPGFAEL